MFLANYRGSCCHRRRREQLLKDNWLYPPQVTGDLKCWAEKRIWNFRDYRRL